MEVKEENKAMVVCFFSKYCEYWDMTDHDVLSDREIRGTLERDVVCFRADVDKNPDTAKKGVSGITLQPFLLKTPAKRLPGHPAVFRRKN